MTSRAQIERLDKSRKDTKNAKFAYKTQTNSPARKRSAFLWLVPTQAAALFAAIGAGDGRKSFAYQFARRNALDDARTLLVSLEAAAARDDDFRAVSRFLRRGDYILVPYSQTEPIHLLVPIATVCAFLIVLFRHKLEIIRLTPLAVGRRRSPRSVSCRCSIRFKAAFSSVSRERFFYLVPMAWFYFGQTR
jgi:hypothetical protein